MKLSKSDRRMNGHKEFTHYVNFPTQEVQKFVEIRRWCDQQWGPSVELDIHLKYAVLRNEHWIWSCHYTLAGGTSRIYLTGEKEASWFGLKWL